MKTTTEKATARQWNVQEGTFVFDENGMRVADCYCENSELTEAQMEAHAELIVRAVNTHDQFVALYHAAKNLIGSLGTVGVVGVDDEQAESLRVRIRLVEHSLSGVVA